MTRIGPQHRNAGRRWFAAAGALLLATQASSQPLSGPLPGPTIDNDRQTTWRTVTWGDFHDRDGARNFGGGDIDRRRRGVQRVGAWLLSAVQIDRIEVVVERDPTRRGEWVARPAAWRVYALMDKERSGFAEGDRSDAMLAHEQRHFDLAEVCARRLRQDVGELSVRAGSRARAHQRLLRELTRAHERLGRHFRLIQKRYDGETDHGLKVRSQRKWSRRIDRWLGQEVPSACDG